MDSRPELMGVAEVAGRLGVSVRRVRQIADSTREAFPPPVRLSCGLVWYAPDVEEWIATHRPDRA